jgi:Zn-dependent protease
MGLYRLLFEDPKAFVLLAIPLLFSLIIHEVAHGWVADKMGDSTARWMGRLTLNPMRHLDPIGTVMLFIFGFGWAKPVPINPNNFRDYRRGLIFVSAAGISANIILAFLARLALVAWNPGFESPLRTVLEVFTYINIMLAAFNLIPIPPLDGSKILMGFSSKRFQLSLERFEPYGFFVILALLYLRVLNPLIYFFQWVIRSVIALIVG